MVSCAAAPPATKPSARPASIDLRMRDLMGVSISCRLMMRERSVDRKLAQSAGSSQAELCDDMAQASARAPLEAGDDLLCHGFDLLLFVFVGDEDDAVDAGFEVHLELLDALFHRAHDGAVHGRFRPGGVVPFGLQPML